jgi:trans-aconitate 2-methyltransferase
MTDSWNAKIYSKFLDLRTRPARDLMSAIPDFFQPKIVCDLGGGPGNSTIFPSMIAIVHKKCVFQEITT